MRGEQGVLGERHVRHRAAPEAFLGDEGEPAHPALRSVLVADRRVVEADRTRVGHDALAREHRHQLLLAVARHTRDADDLAVVHVERDLVQRGAEGVRRGHRQVVDCQAHRADACLAPHRPGQVAADHHPRERGRRLLSRIALAGDASGPEHGRAVAQRADLVELVADVENRHALVRERLQRREQALDRLRRQHRRRLVHDQEARALQQAAHDLDALTLADGHRVHVPVGLERQAVARRHLADAVGEVAADARGLERERDVLGNRQGLEQGEVLEHHADAEPAGARRIADLDRGALPFDRSGVGLDDAVDDLHQRRLAGTVLAQHRVDLAGKHVERDAVVGHHRRVDLGDAVEREARPAGSAHGIASRIARISAATDTAITPGSLLFRPPRPIGQVTRGRSSGATPRASSRRSNWLRLAREPISPR